MAGENAGPAVITVPGAVVWLTDAGAAGVVCASVGRGAVSASDLASAPGATAETAIRVQTIAMIPMIVSWIGRRIQDRDG
jgi:hypothetical protein